MQRRRRVNGRLFFQNPRKREESHHVTSFPPTSDFIAKYGPTFLTQALQVLQQWPARSMTRSEMHPCQKKRDKVFSQSVYPRIISILSNYTGKSMEQNDRKSRETIVLHFHVDVKFRWKSWAIVRKKRRRRKRQKRVSFGH